MTVNKNEIGKLLFVTVDLALIYFGYFLSYIFLTDLTVIDAEFVIDIKRITVMSALVFLTFSIFDLYASWWRKSKKQLLLSVILAMITYSILSFSIPMSIPVISISLSFIIISNALSIILLLSFRLGMWRIGKLRYGGKKVLIIGENSSTGQNLSQKLLNHHKGWFEVCGFLPMVNRKSIEDYVNDVDIFMISPSLSSKEKDEIVSICMSYGKEILIVPSLYEVSVCCAETQQVDDMLVYSIQPPKASFAHKTVKRLFDVVLALLMLFFFSPVLVVLFLLIPITSKGPALYKQERLGLDGRPYWIYKFRSMVQDAEERTGPVLASDKDPRITSVGAFLRAVRLDELPQLFNVLKGEMSIVGPRPEREFFIKKFIEKYADYSLRLSVKPGITGLAQIQANYKTSVEDKLCYDLMYVRSQSIFVDIKILFQTIRVVLQREQAQGIIETVPNSQKQAMQMIDKKVFNQ